MSKKRMQNKRGVRTDVRGNTETPLRDPGALSGLLTGVSFIVGVGGAAALADSPYPRPGSEPAGWLIPAGRFPGLVLSGIAEARLSCRSG